jgi:hypothetical protein
MDLFKTWEVVELKAICMRVLVYLVDDPVYTKEHAARDMKKIIHMLDDWELNISNKKQAAF